MKRLALALVLAGTAAPALADPPPPPSQVEEQGGRSGFWTSRRPANGDEYRYRMLGIGIGLAGGMGLLMWRLVKRANQANRDRSQAASAENARARSA